MKINAEFKSLIPSLLKGEYEKLENSILEDGCRDAIIIWNDDIIDGHNRYEICMEHSVPYKTIEKKFESKDEAKLWIIDNQFGRRNLNKYQRTELALKQKEIIARLAKEKQKLSKGRGKKGLTNSTILNTREIIAKKAGVGSETVYRVEQIMEKANTTQKEKLDNGELSINEVFVEINKTPKTTSSVFRNVIETKPLPETLLNSVCKLIDKNYSSLEDLEFSLLKTQNGWKTDGISKKLLEISMKEKLLDFIERYYLGGEIEATVWEVGDDMLMTKFITGDKSMIGDVKISNIFTGLDSGDEFGVLVTSYLIKLLKPLENDIKLKAHKIDNGDEEKIVSLDLSDTNSTNTYMLSDLSVVQRSKGLKQLPEFHLTFELDKTFMKKYFDSKKALKETKIFTILRAKNGDYKIVLGYSQVNTNRITINVENKNSNNIDRPISFNAAYFNNILSVNRNAEKIELTVSDEGLAHIKVLDGDIEANYYLVEAETDA